MQNHVIFIICDELRADSLGFMGNQIVQTPHLDRLAGDSAIFSRCYCASPMCCPSRASIATGCYPLSHGLMDNGSQMFPGRKSLYSLFQKAGYKTVNVGKWHINKGSQEFGMDRNISNHSISANNSIANKINCFGITDEELRQQVRHKKLPGSALSLIIHGEYPTAPGETTDSLLLDYFLEELETASESEQAHFLRYSMHDPHSPYMPCKPYSELYTPDSIDLPASYRASLENKPLLQRIFYEIRGFQYLEEHDYRQSKSDYFGLVSHVDNRAGEIINKLKGLGMYDDAIIIFTSDHGTMMGEHGYIEKWGHMYEQVVHIPFLIKFPKQLYSGVYNDIFVDNIDTLPTILDFLDISLPRDMDGKSLMPFIYDNMIGHRDETYSMIYSGAFQDKPAVMVRDAEWKCSIYPDPALVERGLPYDHYLKHSDLFVKPYMGGELYDMANDPHEMNNLFESSEYRETRERYCKKIERWCSMQNPEVFLEQEQTSPIYSSDPFAMYRLFQNNLLNEILPILGSHESARNQQ